MLFVTPPRKSAVKREQVRTASVQSGNFLCGNRGFRLYFAQGRQKNCRLVTLMWIIVRP